MHIDDITVIVPTKNELKNIPGLIRSIPPDVHLAVVDASDDGTADLVLKLRKRCTTVVCSPARIAAARNLGAESASTKWLLFTDADVRFSSTYFTNLAKMMPVDAVYGPKLSMGDYIQYYQKFSHWQERFDRLGIPAVSGSNLLVKAETFRRLGGFRPDLLVNEDTELGYRLKKRGFSVRFASNLVVYATDHRRLRYGTFRKDLHTLARCALLYADILPGLLSGRDWGYWSKKN
jgi:glycosyltransferase involved in cell wall biosynthesis